MTLHMIDPGETVMVLVRVTDSGSDVRFYGVGTLDDVRDRIADNAFRVADGEAGDTFTLWHLSPVGALLSIAYEVREHAPIGHAEVIFTWDHPNGTGHGYTTRSESLYYRLPN